MRSGLCWSPCCPRGRCGGPERGRTIGRCQRGVVADPDRVPVAGSTGVVWTVEDPLTTGTAAGRLTVPGPGAERACSAAATSVRSVGRWRSTPPWCGLIIILAVPVTSLRPMCQGRCGRWRWPRTWRSDGCGRRHCTRLGRSATGAGSNHTSPQLSQGQLADRRRWAGPVVG